MVHILRILVLLISACFVTAVLLGGTCFPKWMALFNPVLLLAIVVVLFFYLNPVGKYLMPMAMNIAHFGLFSASLIALRK